MKCSDLKQDDIIIFKQYCDIIEKEDYQDGSVINILNDKVVVCWLEGYKSRVDEIPYNKVVARYNKDGKFMTFGVYSGNSDLIEN